MPVGWKHTRMQNARMSKAPQSLLTSTQASAFLNLSNPKTLSAWRNRHQGPPYLRVGRLVRYKFENLVEWADARKVAP